MVEQAGQQPAAGSQRPLRAELLTAEAFDALFTVKDRLLIHDADGAGRTDAGALTAADTFFFNNINSKT